VRVPGFLARQFIVPGSLRNTATGFSVQARNPIGDGLLVDIGHIRIDGVSVEPAAITAVRSGDERQYHAAEVSRTAPVAFRKGDEVTFHVAGLALDPGDHQLEVELVERDMGRLTIGLTEPLSDGT
jgi:hypothetical protein